MDRLNSRLSNWTATDSVHFAREKQAQAGVSALNDGSQNGDRALSDAQILSQLRDTKGLKGYQSSPRGASRKKLERHEENYVAEAIGEPSGLTRQYGNGGRRPEMMERGQDSHDRGHHEFQYGRSRIPAREITNSSKRFSCRTAHQTVNSRYFQGETTCEACRSRGEQASFGPLPTSRIAIESRIIWNLLTERASGTYIMAR